MRTPLRHCDTCRYGEIREERSGFKLLCAHAHTPPFVVPGWEEISNGEWGWLRRCKDYAPDDKELQRIAQEKREQAQAKLAQARRQWAATAQFHGGNLILPRSE